MTPLTSLLPAVQAQLPRGSAAWRAVTRALRTLAIPATGEQAAEAVCSCIASSDCECSLLPRCARYWRR